jgi:hypothetical protein
MTLKFYTLFTLLFVVVLGNIVYFLVSSESVSVDLFGIHFAAYPVALWVTVPLIVFYLINVVLMSVSSVQSYMKLRNYERDFDRLKDAFYNSYLYKDKEYEYKTNRYKLLGDLVASSHMIPKEGAIIEGDAKIQALFVELLKVDAGEAADLKKYSLSKDNPIMIQNEKNRMKDDDASAEKMLNNSDNYDDATIKAAYASFATTADLSALLKHKQFVSIRSLLQIIARVGDEENPLEFTLDNILEFTRSVTQDINPLGFIELAMNSRQVLVPEDRIKLFETLSAEEFDTSEALLYTYLDLEMIDQARELLENFDEEDFPKYRAFIALKDCDHSCNIDLLVS